MPRLNAFPRGLKDARSSLKRARQVSKARRKAPDKDTLRELYLKSGNKCAFPDCTRVMLNKDGDFVGQICHIEAAEEGGERFNAAMSDQERASSQNLMLMCYDHHVTTNDVIKYTVPMLQAMKQKHEAKFTDPAQAILDGDARQQAGGIVQIGDGNRAVIASNSGPIHMGDNHHHHYPVANSREADAGSAIGLLNWLLANVPSKELSETLPVASRLAKKLGDKAFERWATLEFKGYYQRDMTEGDSVPEYRDVPGRYVDAYKHMAPDDPDVPSMNIYRMSNGVRELEQYAASKNEISLHNPDILRMIRTSLRFNAERFVSMPSAFLGVLDSIRANLLDRLHSIEAEQPAALQAEAAKRVVLPPLALEILRGAIAGKTPINVIHYDGGFGVATGQQQFDSKFHPQRAAELDDAVTRLSEAGWIKDAGGGLFHVTQAGFEGERRLREA
jgi:hypothetical protein